MSIEQAKSNLAKNRRDLLDHAEYIRVLQNRSQSLEEAIKELLTIEDEKPDMSLLNVSQIKENVKKITQKNQSRQAEIIALEKELTRTEDELKDARRMEGIIKTDVKSSERLCWYALYNELLKSLDMELINKLTSIEKLASMEKSELLANRLSVRYLDNEVISKLAVEYGIQ